MADCLSRPLVRAALVLLVVVFAASPAAANTILYQQPDDLTTSSVGTSEGNLAGSVFYFNVFDNFSLASSDAIATVEWEGGYFDNTATTPADPIPAPPSEMWGFGVDILSDIAGNPGAILQRSMFSHADVNETFKEILLNPAGTRFYNLHTYSAALPVAFDATAGTDYWIRIYAKRPTVPTPPDVQWGWTLGTGGDDAAQQFNGDFFFTGVDDRAFTLKAPEPGVALLLGTSLAVVALRRRRRP